MVISIKQIAAVAGVHPSTVSLALRNSTRLPQSTKDRITQIAQDLDYRPNFLAKGLAGQKTQTIGIIVPKLRDLYLVDIIAAQEKWLRSKGYASLLAVTDREPEAERKALDDLFGRGVDALAINYVPEEPAIIKKLQLLADHGVPLSFLGVTPMEGVDEVTWDVFEAGYKIGQYLISRGHRRIVFIGGSQQDDRGKGLRKALEEAGIPFNPQFNFTVNYMFQDISQLRKEIMSIRERPTAVFAYTDDLASEIMVELIDRGYRIPQEVSIVGVSDGWYSARLRVPLTTYHLPQTEIGIAVVEPLVSRLEDPQVEPGRQVFEGHLVIRDSVAPAQGQPQ